MRDLSLHLMDLVQNSVTAGAGHISVEMELTEGDRLKMTIRDDGRGMDQEEIKWAQSPFGTSRTTRKVGLGIPLMKENALRTGGSFSLTGEKGRGICLEAVICLSHIDCIPLGDIAGTMAALVIANPGKPEMLFTLKNGKEEARFDTEEVKQVLQGVSLSEPAVGEWVRDKIKEDVQRIMGGIMQ